MLTVITKSDLDRHIQALIAVWAKGYPEEVKEYKEEARLRRENYDHGVSRGGSFRILGMIPERIRAIFQYAFPGFLDEPENIKRFFGIFDEFCFPSKKRIFLGGGKNAGSS